MTPADSKPVNLGGEPYVIVSVPEDDPRCASLMALAISGSALLTPESTRQLQSLRKVAHDQGLKLAPLIAAELRGVVVGAALAIQSPGRSAMMHLAGAVDQPQPLLVMMLRAAVTELFASGVQLVQGLVHTGDNDLPQAYRSAGFQYLTDLIYMEASAQAKVAAVAPPPGIVLATYEPARDDLFLRALETSYIDSLDCPGLTGLRSTSDVLLGHRATGVFDPKGWYVALRGRAPAGVLLTARVARASALEVVYIGVSSTERGRGVGNYLMQVAHARARELALGVVTLALDATNEPARRLYDRWGYCATQRRRVWIATPARGENLS
ncbi:MAG: GNAT family N-acetyltransferase [Phycisphaerales bacterium]|nr:GNAT family N-acetyltransferase [Phycisphaerales bacterium]